LPGCSEVPLPNESFAFEVAARVIHAQPPEKNVIMRW
jgi:hypothetical protein